MSKSNECNQNSDPLKLIRDGTNQEQRVSETLKPAYAPVNEHGPAHSMLFAQALSGFVKYFDSSNTENGTWSAFFSNDPSIRLAITSVQNIEDYKTQLKSYFDFLNNHENETRHTGLMNNLSYIFSCLATLGKQLDNMKEGLPVEIGLQPTLKNLIKTLLAPALYRLTAYQKGGLKLSVVHDAAPADSMKILGVSPGTFKDVLASGFSQDWITDNSTNWNTYIAAIPGDESVYGSLTGVFARTNHIATHNLFTSISDQFLKVFSRVISEARLGLESTFNGWDRHDPHYALFLSFLRLMEYARDDANTITGRHLDFYYREVLQMKEKPALPAQAHLLVELAKQAAPYRIGTGELFKAGKDGKGVDAFFAGTRDLVANQAKVTSLRTIYRHKDEPLSSGKDTGNLDKRLFASPIANSGDGLGAALTSPDLSWHPFFNKIYSDGELDSIQMPPAEIGFAVASHYLWMAEGLRTITLEIVLEKNPEDLTIDYKNDITCLITGEKGWIELEVSQFGWNEKQNLALKATLSGADPATAPWLAKIHGYNFGTSLPVLIIKLRNQSVRPYQFSAFENFRVKNIGLTVDVLGLKTLAVSNDFGPVDTSKPFQPFGAQAPAGSSLVIGSKEVFQKSLTSATVDLEWLETPTPYKNSPNVRLDLLYSGSWAASSVDATSIASKENTLTIIDDSNYNDLGLLVRDEADIAGNEIFNSASRHGYIRVKNNADFGQKQYLDDLVKYLAKDPTVPNKPAGPPAGPVLTLLKLNYTALQDIDFSEGDAETFAKRGARVFHLAPFGLAEQHPFLKTGSPEQSLYLLPQLRHLNPGNNALPKGDPVFHEAEFIIGLEGLKPPQNLAILFQVADGTADPLTKKPPQHINWSFLAGNEWIQFDRNDVEDHTAGLLKSGIITFSMPREASDTNTLLPSGQHWIRAAVSEDSKAVCRLVMVAAQGLPVKFTDRGNDPAFASKVLPAGTISKMDIPVAEIKKITQPYESFGGRGAEDSSAFYTRVSERLRHKDRGVTQWDYERLILEAFPEIYRAKCLNHTQYEPTSTGEGIYRELAPGHVTIVTIPNKQFHNLSDPLKPYTSLGLLQDIAEFIGSRISCFVKLHVENPQFEEVWLTMNARLYDGFDESYSKKLLQEAIMRFLSPWAFPGGGSPTFGGKIYKSVLIDFIEEQPYVDYVTDVQLFHNVGKTKGITDENEIEGSTAVSILVSVPANQHSINFLHTSEGSSPSEKCTCQP